MHEVELNVLPRGDVADVVGILFRQCREHHHLLRIEPAEGDLDPLHPRRVEKCLGALGQAGVGEALGGDAVVTLAVVVALAVGAAAQACLGEDFLVDLPGLAQDDLRLELVDLLRPERRHIAGELFLPTGLIG